MKEYDHSKLEKKWQTTWEKKGIYHAKDTSSKPKYFSLIEFPYPSGDGLHVGHPRPYIGMDIISRKRRLEGFNVLYPIGWDAFGLPTENYAIKTGKDPRVVTKKNSDTFRKQIKSLGISFDWSREINTTDPKYYKWTQWIFLQFLKKGLAYKTKTEINWCPKDKIGLANEEVIGGNCERCGTPVEKKEKEQWMLAITKYADRLDKDLDEVDYLPQIKLAQRNWIGKSEGAEIDFSLLGVDEVKKIIILHGKHGRPDNYNYKWLKEELEKRGYEVELPLLPNTEEPNDEEQADYIQKNFMLDEKTALVCHSFGGVVAMRLLERGMKVARVTLIATPFSGKFKDKKVRKSVTEGCEKGFDFITIKKNSKTFIILQDETDLIVPDEDAREWEKNLSGMLIKGHGNVPHFCGETEPDMILASSPNIRVFTTRPDTIFGATYLVLSPETKLVKEFRSKIENFSEVEKYIKELKKKTEIERIAEDKIKTGIELKGIKAINPATKEEIPVWIADYVLSGYGTGAIMAVPAHDERDFEFAKRYNLPIKQVIVPCAADSKNPPRPGLEEVKRDTVIVHLRDKSTGKFALLDWHGTLEGITTAIMGGIEPGQTPEEAALMEILEEAAIKNVKIIKKAQFITAAKYCASHKNQNRCANTYSLLAEVENLTNQGQISPQEQKIHTLIWVEEHEVLNRLTPDHQKQVWQMLHEKEIALTGEGYLINSSQFNGFDSEKVKKEIIKFVGGKEKTTFKLRDWVFSRQRYWGEPIPVIFCEKCGAVPVPEKDLPVELPKVKNYQPTDSGESPLANISKWVNTKCSKCKGNAKRETDTMPNWAGSSWYYLRYADSKNKKEFASKKNLKYWTPVDWYNGGNEHTTLHLLYSRFWHKFLFDLELVPTSEPYKKRTSHGLILAEGGEKMSKSKGNVVNPDQIVKLYGADTLRVYEMFMGPFSQAVSWSTESIIGSRRFIEKVWRIGEGMKTQQNFDRVGARLRVKRHNFAESSIPTQKLLNKTIKKVGEDIEEMRFNTAISSLMILATEMEKTENIPIEDYKKFLVILSPFAPHVAEELWSAFGEKKSIHLSSWPTFNKDLIADEEIKIAVQINGKVRGEIMTRAEEEENEIKDKALKNEDILRYTQGKEIKKVIYVKNRLINIVL